MSDDRLPPGQEHLESGMPPQSRGGCLSVFLVLLGIVLLLPGVCAIILIAIDWRSALSSGNFGFIFVCLAVAVAGVLLIRAAIRS